MLRICLAIVLVWLSGSAWALLPATLDSDNLRLPLGSSMAYVEDPQGTLGIEQYPHCFHVIRVDEILPPAHILLQ